MNGLENSCNDELEEPPPKVSLQQSVYELNEFLDKRLYSVNTYRSFGNDVIYISLRNFKRNLPDKVLYSLYHVYGAVDVHEKNVKRCDQKSFSDFMSEKLVEIGYDKHYTYPCFEDYIRGKRSLEEISEIKDEKSDQKKVEMISSSVLGSFFYGFIELFKDQS